MSKNGEKFVVGLFFVFFWFLLLQKKKKKRHWGCEMGRVG